MTRGNCRPGRVTANCEWWRQSPAHVSTKIMIIIIKTKQRILLDCDQSNVLLTRIIFFCILLRALSFLSIGIRDPASNWDPFNIILIVPGVEVVIGNCLPEVHKILPDFRNWEEKLSNNSRWRLLPFVLLYLNPCVYLAPLWRYGASNIIKSRLWPFGVTWRHRSRDHSTPGSRLSMGGL